MKDSTNRFEVRHFVRELVSGLLGAFVGLGVSYYALIFFGWLFFGAPFMYVAWIFVAPTALIGTLGGFFFGGWLSQKHPRVFWATVLPMAACFAFPIVLRNIDRPHHYSIRITGTQGADFTGYLDVDRKRQRLNSSVPASYDFWAWRIEYAVALVDQNAGHEMSVTVLADGSLLGENHLGKVTTGEFQILRSFGYSEFFGGTSSSWSRLSLEEAQELVATGELKRIFRLGPRDL